MNDLSSYITLIGMHELHGRINSNPTGQLSVSHTYPVAHNKPLKIWLLGNAQVMFYDDEHGDIDRHAL